MVVEGLGKGEHLGEKRERKPKRTNDTTLENASQVRGCTYVLLPMS
jgi:hypothetical protein